jgi:hypothetical protein
MSYFLTQISQIQSRFAGVSVNVMPASDGEKKTICGNQRSIWRGLLDLRRNVSKSVEKQANLTSRLNDFYARDHHQSQIRGFQKK